MSESVRSVLERLLKPWAYSISGDDRIVYCDRVNISLVKGELEGAGHMDVKVKHQSGHRFAGRISIKGF